VILNEILITPHVPLLGTIVAVLASSSEILDPRVSVIHEARSLRSVVKKK